MEIGIRVEAENSYTGNIRHVVSAYFTFVALNEKNQPVIVPKVQVETPVQERRATEADLRRKLRLDTRNAIKASRSTD